MLYEKDWFYYLFCYEIYCYQTMSNVFTSWSQDVTCKTNKFESFLLRHNGTRHFVLQCKYLTNVMHPTLKLIGWLDLKSQSSQHETNSVIYKYLYEIDHFNEKQFISQLDQFFATINLVLPERYTYTNTFWQQVTCPNNLKGGQRRNGDCYIL